MAKGCSSPQAAARAERPAEERLSRLWYGEAFSRPELRTSCGRRVRVLYRGLPNGDRGPDYLGAVLSLGRGRPRPGDIELHVRTSQWRAHGHHLDARYDAVILHVVWEDDDPQGTILSCGRQVPVLALGSLASAAGRASTSGEPCRQASGPQRERLVEVLDRAGEARFLGAAARLEGEMAVYPSPEVLYQALAEALGYSRNKAPFRCLASSLPLAVLEGYLWGKGAERQEELAQALLLGAAGLLPSQRGQESREEWPGRLEELYKASGLDRCLAPGEWSLGVRPGNHPARRLAGLASIVVESLEEGLVEWAASRVRVQGSGSKVRGQGSGVLGQGSRAGRQASSPGSLYPGPCTLDPSPSPWPLYPGPSTLDPSSTGSLCPGPSTLDPAVAWLRREARGYWRGHYDFGRPGSWGPCLVGRARALEMAANALLPFLYAYGQVQGDGDLSRAALEAYGRLPSPGYNQITRHMARQLLASPRARPAGTACRQQGLLHLFRSYCTRGRCGGCPLAERV